MTKNIHGSLMGGGLLISGTCIGAGMLGLPVVTAAAGFYPTLGAFLLVWCFMTFSALAYLEVCLRFKDDTNLISMAGKTLGPVAKSIAWFAFLFFLMSLMSAYTAGGTNMLARIGDQYFDEMGVFMIALIFIIPFMLMVYLGTIWVDRLNRLLMIGLIATFVGLCALALQLEPAHAFYPVGNPKYLLFTLPLLVTSFGYHLLIPSLKDYLGHNVKKLRLVILIGSCAPFAIYAIWELIIIYLIPTWGDGGLVSMLESGLDPANAMTASLATHGNLILQIVTWFSFFALTSSFLGVGLGIFDFLSDGFKIRKAGHGRLILSFLTFGPPLLFTFLFPHGFLLALGYAGIFASVLLILYPVCMAWSARYVHKLKGPYQMSGGKPLLAITFVFGVIVVLADILSWLKIFPLPHN